MCEDETDDFLFYFLCFGSSCSITTTSFFILWHGAKFLAFFSRQIKFNNGFLKSLKRSQRCQNNFLTKEYLRTVFFLFLRAICCAFLRFNFRRHFLSFNFVFGHNIVDFNRKLQTRTIYLFCYIVYVYKFRADCGGSNFRPINQSEND